MGYPGSWWCIDIKSSVKLIFHLRVLGNRIWDAQLSDLWLQTRYVFVQVGVMHSQNVDYIKDSISYQPKLISVQSVQNITRKTNSTPIKKKDEKRLFIWFVNCQKQLQSGLESAKPRLNENHKKSYECYRLELSPLFNHCFLFVIISYYRCRCPMESCNPISKSEMLKVRRD